APPGWWRRRAEPLGSGPGSVGSATSRCTRRRRRNGAYSVPHSQRTHSPTRYICVSSPDVMGLLRALQAAVVTVSRVLSSLVRSAARGLSSAGQTVGRAARAAVSGAVALLPAEWKKPIAALFVVGLATVPVIYSGNMT